MLISKLISPIQAAFVPSRKGIDNVVIAQELFYALDKEKRETRVHGHQGRLGKSLIGDMPSPHAAVRSNGALVR